MAYRGRGSSHHVDTDRVLDDLSRREEILGMGREEYRGGSLQVEFGKEPQAILRRGAELWQAFLWDPELKRHRSRGDIASFGYDASTRVPDPWRGGGAMREDGKAYGTIVVNIARNGRD